MCVYLNMLCISTCCHMPSFFSAGYVSRLRPNLYVSKYIGIFEVFCYIRGPTVCVSKYGVVIIIRGLLARVLCHAYARPNVFVSEYIGMLEVF